MGEHPFRTWRLAQKLSYEMVCKLAAAFGRELGYRYVEAIEVGYRRPSYDVAKVLSRVSGGIVTIETFMEWRRPARKGAA